MTVRLSEGMAGQQLGSLRRSNAAAVLRAVRSGRTLSRSEIAVTVGLSPTAVTKIAGELLDAGFITEVQMPSVPAREPGRPRRPVEVDRSVYRFVGVHFGMQRVTGGLVDLSGEVVTTRIRAHSSTRPRNVVTSVRRMVDELLTQTGTPPEAVLGYGACCGGWVSARTGTVREFAALGWRDVELSQALAQDGLPEPRVESSVRALALAEAGLTTAQGVDNVLYLFIGNVIGCANVLHGRIARGREESAGMIDHLGTPTRSTGLTCSCGRRDCLWAVASDAAVITAAVDRELLPEGAVIEDLVSLCRTAGSASTAAARLLDERARRVGHALGTLLDLYDPDLVVVGGGVRLAPEFFPTLIAAARKHAVRPADSTPIRPAELVGAPALVRGAATVALDAFYADPLACTA